MSHATHLYLTFNPHLNQYVDSEYTQAHEFYEYLVEELKNSSKGYAYWGKIIGDHREPKADLEKFRKVLTANQELGYSTHLYITDFRNLWVGKIDTIKKNIGTDFKTLSFYKNKKVEVWFKITDFTLLEYTTEGTANKLSELYIDNPHMDLKIDELSPFTTGIKYPAFVQDLADEHYFDEMDESESSHLALRYNSGINDSGISRVVHSLHNLALPEHLYNKIPHSARTEIETAEMDTLEKRTHNLNKIAFSYVKAVEIIVNDLTIHHLKKLGYGDSFFTSLESMPPKLYFDNNNKDGMIPISKFKKNYSIGQILSFIQRGMRANNFGFKKAFQDKKDFLRYLTGDFAHTIERNQIITIRNILAHSDSNIIDAHDANAIRSLMLGIGCRGIIHSLYQTFYNKDYPPVAQVRGVYNEKLQKNPSVKLKLAS